MIYSRCNERGAGSGKCIIRFASTPDSINQRNYPVRLISKVKESNEAHLKVMGIAEVLKITAQITGNICVANMWIPRITKTGVW